LKIHDDIPRPSQVIAVPSDSLDLLGARFQLIDLVEILAVPLPEEAIFLLMNQQLCPIKAKLDKASVSEKQGVEQCQAGSKKNDPTQFSLGLSAKLHG